MSMDDPIVQERLQQLAPEYRAFIESDYAEMTAKVFGEKLVLTKEHIDIFENGLLLYLLLFINKAELATFLSTYCEVPVTKAEEIVASINLGLPEAVFTALSEFEDMQAQFAHQESASAAAAPAVETEAAAVSFTPQSVATETADTSNAPLANPETPTVAPMRTMQSDFAAVHGYGAYRDQNPDEDANQASPASEPAPTVAPLPPTPTTPAPTEGEAVAFAPSPEGPQPVEEPVIVATPQAEVLGNQPPLTDTPSYQPPTSPKS